ncbi:hypothetical protein BN855_12080 [Salmonella enterica subsp. enterica serovar Bovismorbificans str. 3114]|nr:hypothetical protein BN855_12080 [Salmonella enterica subsp. enterica serovar Bovismorbificans str. 3114]
MQGFQLPGIRNDRKIAADLNSLLINTVPLRKSDGTDNQYQIPPYAVTACWR